MIIHSYREWRGSGEGPPPKGWLVWHSSIGYYAVKVLGNGPSRQANRWIKILRPSSWAQSIEKAKDLTLRTKRLPEFMNLCDWNYGSHYKSVQWFPDECQECERRSV